MLFSFCNHLINVCYITIIYKQDKKVNVCKMIMSNL